MLHPRSYALGALVLAGCSGSAPQVSTPPEPAAEPTPAPPGEPTPAAEPGTPPAPSAHAHRYFHREEQPHPAWGYAAEDGPEKWSTLDPSYAHCAGQAQSPIDLPTKAPAGNTAFTLRYALSQVHLVYNGHTVQETEDAGSFLDVSDTAYALAQFHFHSPSEHTIAGSHTAMEMHLVHKSDAGEVAVLAVMIEPGDQDNPAFETLWGYLPTEEARKSEAKAHIDTAAMLPANKRASAYRGSFTTPPCTEEVQWFVLEEPIFLSQAQIDAFRSIIRDNNRPVQPLHGRSITGANP